MTGELVAIVVYLIWNISVFALYGIDKSRAKRSKWRISENALLLSTALMGGVGALLGMKIFHHKTKHTKFKICVPLAAILNIAIFVAIVYFKRRII